MLFPRSAYRNKNVISRFQLDDIYIQVNEQLGNLLSFFDHTEAMISTNDIRTKTVPIHTGAYYLVIHYFITYGKKSAISSPTVAVNVL